MKNQLLAIIGAVLCVASALGQTTNSVSRPINSIELTLGGGGNVVNGQSAFGTDITFSTNPLKPLPSVWVGVAQGIYWEPNMAGSTDLYVDWSQDIWNDTLYLNGGWSGGVLYGSNGTPAWRTGPEVSLQFYTHDNAFIYAGVNYDVWSTSGDHEWRYSFGIGILF